MGLNFADDLDGWQRWQRGRHLLRRVKDLVRRPEPRPLVVHLRGEEPRVLFALDATTPTALASVLEPLAALGDLPVAVVAPADLSHRMPGEWIVHTVAAPPADLPAELRSVRAVVAAGHFLPVGQAAHRWAQSLDATFVVVQHGLLTPFAPPLPPDAHLLAFTDADAQFWRSGRTDVTSQIVGSQLLWKAAAAPAVGSGELVFLGQLHGAELRRRIRGGTAARFCLDNGALYRPHPAETDRLSRWQHRRWQRRGIRFASDAPLAQSAGPVASIFSTGVLEAAAAGRDAWVTCQNPPPWVREFWQRYALASWGESPTAPPPRPPVEPVRAIADVVRTIIERH